MWNTVYIAVMKIAANLVVPIVFALLLNEVRKTHLKEQYRPSSIFPISYHGLYWVEF